METNRHKVLLNKKWLSGADAVGLLEVLIESRVSDTDFIDLAMDHSLAFYVNGSSLIDNYKCGLDVASGMLVHTTNGEPARILTDQMIRVLSPRLSEERSYFADGHGWGGRLVLDCLTYDGNFEAFSDDAVLVQWSAAPYCADLSQQIGRSLTAFFKAVDIRALADVINGASSNVSYCDVAALKSRIAKLEDENAKLRAASHTSDGFVFPYSTPELEVMRDMAVKYWANYDPETDRKPLQKQVGIEISEKMSWMLSGCGSPSRQAMPLATAIQPEQYRDKK